MTSRELPPGVEVYEINGPLFFGVADRLQDTLRMLERPPRVFVLRMRRVPAIDATGLHALEEFYEKCRRQGTVLLLSGVHAQPLVAFHRARFDDRLGSDSMFGSLDDALDRSPGNHRCRTGRAARRRPCRKWLAIGVAQRRRRNRRRYSFLLQQIKPKIPPSVVVANVTDYRPDQLNIVGQQALLHFAAQ